MGCCFSYSANKTKYSARFVLTSSAILDAEAFGPEPEKSGAGIFLSPNKLLTCEVISLLSVVFTATVGIFIGFAPEALREFMLADSEAAAPADNPVLANDDKL